MIKYYSLAPFFFDRVVLRHPRTVILCVLAVAGFLAFQARHFRLDASAETLVLENDRDLRYSRLISSRYGQNDFLVLTYTPRGDLFSPDALASLARLRDDLKSIQSVSSVLSILDVPLLESPPVSLKDLTGDLPTLESPSVDKDMARIELGESPLYRDMLLSSDLQTTALLITFSNDDVYRDLLERRTELRQRKATASLTRAERAELKNVVEQFQRYRDKMRQRRHQDIVAIRTIMDKYRSDADLFLGGVSMIADDMITFIKNDLKIFGLGGLLFLILTLGIIFRNIRWIWLPMLCCLVSVVCMIGLLGWLGWEVTVISANFISLQLIITMAIAIHLIVLYRELLVQSPQAANRQLIFDTVRLKLKPCVYAMLTTIAGFGSLVLCGILPVVMFGWMMIIGLIVSLVVTFLLFPAVLTLLPKEKPPAGRQRRFAVASMTARFTQAHGTLIISVAGLVLIFSLIGLSRLEVENSFIDYFKDTTEIYRGMKVIDQSLGGTTPLDVVIDFEKSETLPAAAESGLAPDQSPADAGTTPHRPPEPAGESQLVQRDETFDEFNEFDEAASDEKYWFTAEKTARVKAVHNYLDSLPQTGKVLSLATMLAIAEKLKGGKPLDSFELALLYSQASDEFKTMLIKPYVSLEHNQVRFWVRVRDSEKTLRRNELLKKIKADLPGILGLDEGHVHLAGLLVLYNNMLQTLFGSQILTLGITVLVLMAMFLVLFRSLIVALIAIFPNVLSIAAVLGVMGWLNIPLDMMTITIAAISVGIAVDDTIHYIHRFKREFQQDHNYVRTMHRCHGSVGHAMYYTSVVIIMGFSILALSNFIPSIYFGLLTGLAMLIALIAALTLLPQMIILVKPFGRET
jgi:predicted RND superfamily exporter protein